MANKKITDLTLISAVDDDLSLPADDGIQTYRTTIAQIKTFILSAQAITRTMIEQSQRLPIGGVMPFGGTTAPSGWLMCDGSAVSRTTYSDLFTVIGVAHGSGDGSTTFCVPDYRGVVIRGVDGSAGLDPDKASRSAMNYGGNTGNNVGSVQSDSFASHNHAAGTLAVPANDTTLNTTISPDDNGARLRRADIYTTAGANIANSPILIGSSDITGGTETRMKNAYANFIIKF